MLTTRSLVAMFWVGMMALATGVVCAQNYPNERIRIVTSQVAGTGDFVSRLIAQGIAGPLGQPVIVENRGGSAGPAEAVAQAAPDGYTLLLDGVSFWLSPFLQKTPYDPVKDFSPVVLTTRSPSILVVTSSLPVKSVKELIALAKAKPGELNFTSGGAGGSSHLAAELFKSLAGVNIVRVPYSSSSQEIADLIGGRVQINFGNPSAVGPHIKSGALRALAVTTMQPSALFPELPTMSASGVPGYEWVGVTFILAPAKTPGVIINRLNQEIVRVLGRPDVKERLLNTGLEAVGSSPEELATLMKSSMATWSKVIKEAGIKGD